MLTLSIVSLSVPCYSTTELLGPFWKSGSTKKIQ